MKKIQLDSPLAAIYGSSRFLPKLKKLEIRTVKDLLCHFPTRYEDWSEISAISVLKPGDLKTIQGEIISVNLARTPRRRMMVLEALISDKSGSIIAVWFNQPYLKKSLSPGKWVSLSGKAVLYKGRLVLQNPTYEIIRRLTQKSAPTDTEKDSQRESALGTHTGRIVPIYRETKGLTSKGIRYLIRPLLKNLPELPEYLPEKILNQFNLPKLETALQVIHFPPSLKEARRALKSLAFRDLFLLQLKNLEEKQALRRQKAHPVKYEIETVKKILAQLPFELTLSQKKALWEILQDIAKPHPMNRLLQGDVGSGKTIVAGIAAITAASEPNNLQAAFMAPTEILARQHYQTLTKFFKDFSGGIALLTAKEARVFYGDELETTISKPQLIKQIAAGQAQIVIGTHALIQKNVIFSRLGLVVVDEQHRFGVEQRATLLRRSSLRESAIPHYLSMSATPIPRTLTMAIFGNLDLSLIRELPAGRKKIITKIVDPADRPKAYAFIRKEVKKGRQVFVICPRIEPRTNADDRRTNADNYSPEPALSPHESALLEVKAVKEEYEKLANKIFRDLRVGMLHGKMKTAEKDKIMKDFAAGRLDILVATSVVEVGVDVPNATIMMIEGAERFGLAQLYQFRGRVGRGEHQSFCFLFTDSTSRTVKERLSYLVKAKGGFELAEKDLQLRGPGEFLGQDQTGMPDIALKALQNPEELKKARQAAEAVIQEDPELKKYPLLRERLNQFEKEIHLE
jgi:ATP-dependent DNA helicase RecG